MAKAEKLGWPAAGFAFGSAGFLDQFLLFDQSPKILFVQQSPRQGFHRALKLHCVETEQTLMQFVVAALREKLARKKSA